MATEEYDMDIQEKAQHALDNRVYVAGWSLSHELRKIRDGISTNMNVELYIRDGVPIGVAIYDHLFYMVMVFVRKAYRRQGIGTSLVAKVTEDVTRKHSLVAGEGIRESRLFFEKNGVST